MKLDDKELLIGLYLAYFGRPMRYYDEIIFSHLKGDQNISNSFSTWSGIYPHFPTSKGNLLDCWI